MPPSAPSKTLALARSTHPGPTVAVTAVTALLAAGIGLEPWRVLVVAAAMLLGQASVGLSNDWIDAHRDVAVGRLDKPVARGWIDVGTVRATSFVTAVLAIALTVPLGWAATLAHALFIASAWGYNVWLKRSVFSVVPYLVSFGLLPAIVTLAAERPQFAALWAVGAGALLGVAAHFSNVLPDLHDDAVTGIAGLPHRLGRRASVVAIAAALALASALLVFGPQLQPGVIQWSGFGLSIALAAACIVVGLTRPPTRLLFRFIMLAAIVNVALLALAGEALYR